MSYAEELVRSTITRSTRTASREGFGRALFACYHTHFAGRTKLYTQDTWAAEMVADHFAVTDPAYLAAQSYFSQNPAPPDIKIGRRALPFTQVVRLTPDAPVAGTLYTLTVDGVALTYTATMYDTLAALCTALALQIHAAAPGVTASGTSGTYVDCTGVAGVLHTYGGLSDTMRIEDRTTDPGLATDLAAIFAADEDWYGLLLDSNSAAEIKVACVWTEANKREFVWQNSDSADLDVVVHPTTDADIFSYTKNAGYVRSGGMFYPSLGDVWIAGAWVGEEFPKDPGASNWMWKSLAGISAYSLTSAQMTNLEAKNGNHYTPLDSSNNITGPGNSASGDWLDIVRDFDWLNARLREAGTGVFLVNDKLPFTDEGISQLVSAVRSVLVEAVDKHVLASFVVRPPLASSISSTIKRARGPLSVPWTGVIAGAINTMEITGLVTY